jgi:light-regulated signal transduction histidine kinase (bacteriophytochrome)
MHIQKQSALIICEFETKQDTFSPIHPPVDGFPVEPIRITEHEATAAERLLSTTSKSKPLHAVNVARKLSHPLGAMDLFHALCEIQAQLSSAESLETLLDIIVGLVYEITGFHRVMVYQFDETAAGMFHYC